MPSELQLHPVKLKCKLKYKSHYMYDMICKDHVMCAITWWKQHNMHYRNIKLNKQWCSDITSTQLSLHLNDIDNCITVNEDVVLNKSLKNYKLNIDTPKENDNQELCTTQVSSTTTDTNNSETHEDNEVAEEQIAINKRQELTGDPLPSVLQFENLENQIYQCAPGQNNIPKYTLLDNDFKVLTFPDIFP